MLTSFLFKFVFHGFKAVMFIFKRAERAVIICRLDFIAACYHELSVSQQPINVYECVNIHNNTGRPAGPSLPSTP